VAAALNVYHPWSEHATSRLEVYNRIQMWRALTNDTSFDIDYWATRVANRPGRAR
jgi:hypothetical protein